MTEKEVRASYDKTYCLPIEAVGYVGYWKPQKAEPKSPPKSRNKHIHTKYSKEIDRIVGTRGLAIAIILRAVQDWKRLCSGDKATRDCNFDELNLFFSNECEKLIAHTNVSIAEIQIPLQMYKLEAIIKHVNKSLERTQ